LAALSRRDVRARSASHAPYVPPSSPLETTLVGLFEDMLGAEQVGVNDNFFDLGGNSLVATQLISRLREVFGVDLSLRVLFEAPTVAELSVEVVRAQAGEVDADELAAALAELEALSPEDLEAQLAGEAEPQASEGRVS
jgi:acyl carrier protein